MRIKKIVGIKREINRRYHLHRQLRSHGMTVNVKQRTIMADAPPSGRVSQWCCELEQYAYHIQLTMPIPNQL